MDDYRTLAQTTISGVCGRIKFSPDCQCLYCSNIAGRHPFPRGLFRLDVNVGDDGGLSLDISHNEVSFHPWEFESGSEPGFLLGDPFYLPPKPDEIDLVFVLDKQCVLIGDDNAIAMLQLDELTKDSVRGGVMDYGGTVVFSLNGDRLFIITDRKRKLMVLDISSGMFKPGKKLPRRVRDHDYIVAVREGLLFQSSDETLELWDFELRECIRSWNVPDQIRGVLSISEDQVACVCGGYAEGWSEVVIVDTARKGFVSIFTTHGREIIACSSKYHVITFDGQELQMQCGAVVFWKIAAPSEACLFDRGGSFSPTEQYYIIEFSNAFYVLDVALGRTLRTLQPLIPEGDFLETGQVKFVSDEEYVACFHFCFSPICFLQLFNVKSGDLLSEIALERVNSLVACPREGLVAILYGFCKKSLKVLRVKLPGDQHSRRRKRIKPKE